MSDPSARPLVLIVDDFEDARVLYRDFLSAHGYDVAEARDGAEAIDLARRMVPDVILMDLSMPGIDGWQATRVIRADPRSGRIPIIALTGHAIPAYADSAKDAGCDRVVIKPYLPTDLLQLINEVLGRP